MAGIKQALKRVMDGRNRGKVIAMGTANPEARGYNPETKYIIIELTDGGHITEYHSGDVRIDPRIRNGDEVILNILDNKCARWMRTQDRVGPHVVLNYSRKMKFRAHTRDVVTEAVHIMQDDGSMMASTPPCGQMPLIPIDKMPDITSALDYSKTMDRLDIFLNGDGEFGLIAHNEPVCANPPIFVLAMNCNNGKFPEYKYWREIVSGIKPEYWAGCSEDFESCIDYIRKWSPNACVAGIYDSMKENHSLALERLSKVDPVPVSEITNEHEERFLAMVDALHDKTDEWRRLADKIVVDGKVIKDRHASSGINRHGKISVSFIDVEPADIRDTVVGDEVHSHFKNSLRGCDLVYIHQGDGIPPDAHYGGDGNFEIEIPMLTEAERGDMAEFMKLAASEGADVGVVVTGPDGRIGMYAWKKEEE